MVSETTKRMQNTATDPLQVLDDDIIDRQVKWNSTNSQEVNLTCGHLTQIVHQSVILPQRPSDLTLMYQNSDQMTLTHRIPVIHTQQLQMHRMQSILIDFIASDFALTSAVITCLNNQLRSELAAVDGHI